MDAIPEDPTEGLSDADIDELRDEFVALAPVQSRVDSRRRALSREIDQREKKARITNRLAQMSPEDRAAMMSALEKMK